MTNVLVTGSNGQLGKCLQDISISDTNNIKWIFKSSQELDITEENAINETFENNKIDYVVNCAAYTAVDKAETEIEKAFLVNAEAVRFLANACKEHHATLIHISTDFVFDGQKDTPYTEEDFPNPINVYGKSKLKGEQYVQEILNKYFIIRTSWVYSEYGHNFVKTMLRLGKEKNELHVVSDQFGTPTYAVDLAEIILNIISNNRNSYGLYHYSNEGVVSWHGFAMAIFKETNMDINLNSIQTEKYPTHAKRPNYSELDKSKIKNFLNMEISHWRNVIKKCLNIINKL